ncbi:MAG: galactokinase [Anaerolineaceae bacterium]|nr:galactokinase [Anaerolineaceae bacterium]MBN2678042.1 galactokinase [Anaerolineaceae bacterium]
MMNPREKALAEFQKRFGWKPDFIGRAPGRVNLMGEHVDYNDGFVLPVAIDRTVAIAFSPSDDDCSTILAADFSSEIELDPHHLAARHDRHGQTLAGWALYPAGIQYILREEGLSAPGMRAVVSADIPSGAGLSSSAAIELAFMIAWQTLGGWEQQAAKLAVLAQQAENQYVGVRCGIMDQYASACGLKGHAIFLDCRDLTSRPVALPPDHSFVIADSGVHHSLAAGAYNDRRAACEEAVRLLREWLPDIRALRDVSIDEVENYAARLPDEARQAARHVAGEIERTRRAVEQLEAGDVKGFGSRMLESHASLRDLYQVSCTELDTLVRIAIDLPGCLGSRLTGGGFGGCTVNLVQTELVDAFMDGLKRRYQAKTGIRSQVTICQAVDGAGVVRL